MSAHYKPASIASLVSKLFERSRDRLSRSNLEGVFAQQQAAARAVLRLGQRVEQCRVTFTQGLDKMYLNLNGRGLVNSSEANEKDALIKDTFNDAVDAVCAIYLRTYQGYLLNVNPDLCSRSR